MSVAITAPAATPATAVQIDAGAATQVFLTPAGIAASKYGKAALTNQAIKTANYTLGTADFLIIGNSATPITIDATATNAAAVAAAINAGKPFYFQNKGAGAMTLDFTGNGGINAANTVILGQGDALLICSDGTTYGILAAYQPAQPAVAISALDINWAAGAVFAKTLTANSTFTFSNTTDGDTKIVALTNTASNYTVTWPAGIKWTGGAAPVQTTGAKTDVYTFVKIGSTIYGSVVQNLS
jgi:hypothetical protein